MYSTDRTRIYARCEGSLVQESLPLLGAMLADQLDRHSSDMLKEEHNMTKRRYEPNTASNCNGARMLMTAQM